MELQGFQLDNFPFIYVNDMRGASFQLAVRHLRQRHFMDSKRELRFGEDEGPQHEQVYVPLDS